MIFIIEFKLLTMTTNTARRCNAIKNGSPITDEGLALLARYNDDLFINWFYNEYIPSMQPGTRMLLRSDFTDVDRNLINTARSMYNRIQAFSTSYWATSSTNQ